MIKLPAYFDRFSSRSDGSASLSFSTQEISAEQFAEFKRSLNQFGWLAFRENELQAEDVPDGDAEEEKTPSKRLRSVLFLLWKQGGGIGDSETFYREHMEKFINHVKSKLH